MGSRIEARHLKIISSPMDDIGSSELRDKFNKLMNEIQKYLALEPIIPARNVSISFIENLPETSIFLHQLGVNRVLDNNRNLLTISVSEHYRKYLQIILLREVYFCFIPLELHTKKIIDICLHEIIESELPTAKGMNDWKEIFRKKVMSYKFLHTQLDDLDKFFKIEGTERTQSGTQFFFEFIHRNVPLIQDEMDNFYDWMYHEFLYKNEQSLYNDEMLETLQIFSEIFEHKRIFTNYTDYERFLQEFKENGTISTYQSNAKFKENLRWMNKCTPLFPSYQMKYHSFGIAILQSRFRFNPILPRKDIYSILNMVPFIHNPFSSRNGFSDTFFCFFLVPVPYIKDLTRFLDNLSNHGYLVQNELQLWTEHNNNANANYFRDNNPEPRKIIDPDHKKYARKFEFVHKSYYSNPKQEIHLNLLEWLVLYLSYAVVVGFKFEGRKDRLQKLRDKTLDNIESERVLIKNFMGSVDSFYNSPLLKEEFFEFLDTNRKFGFLYLENKLEGILKCITVFERLIKDNPHITTFPQFKDFVNTYHLSHHLDEILKFKLKDIQTILYRDFIQVYFHSKQHYKIVKEKYQDFFQILAACKSLKIMNISNLKALIANKEESERIYSIKDKKLKRSYETYKPYKITDDLMLSNIKRFLDADIITPNMSQNIITSTIAKYHPVIYLNYTTETFKTVEEIGRFFPRIEYNRCKDFAADIPLIAIFLFFLNIREKELFCSIMYSLFSKEIISFQRFFTNGITPYNKTMDFYDFDARKFFYSKDVFEQAFLYIQHIFGDVRKPLPERCTNSQHIFWQSGKTMKDLVEEVDKRVGYEKLDFTPSNLDGVTNLHKDLDLILKSITQFRRAQNQGFFKNNIESIKFFPNFHAFGLDQYYLYIHPSNMDEIDFRHLLNNSFQSIKYPTIIDTTNSFFIKYIFPFNTPNMKHVNWYTKTKKVIREYCLFSIKSISQILNLNKNVTAKGWDYDSNRFQIHIQNILFDPTYERKSVSQIRKLELSKVPNKRISHPESQEFNALSELYSWNSDDIKSFLGRNYHNKINAFTTLFNENLIFPYISLKNFDFQDTFYIILPGVDHKWNHKFLQIFNFFNYGFIYEIEGEFYIHGFDKEERFENGFMIKLYFPQCELHEFITLFDQIFEYMGIDRYIMLSDLANGKYFLKSLYGDLDFLKKYNPLKNLIWNDKDKIWMNHKLYTEKFVKLYPPLMPLNDSEEP